MKSKRSNPHQDLANYIATSNCQGNGMRSIQKDLQIEYPSKFNS